MGYRAEKVDMPISVGQIQEFEYALLYGISDVKLARTEELEGIDWEECREARFFSKDRELHVFEVGDGQQAVLVSDDNEEDRIVKQYEMAPRFRGIGRVLDVVEYLIYDEDGQMRVGLTRLAGVGKQAVERPGAV